VCSWRAGCGGSRKSGSEGGGEETTGRKAGTGASPPTLRERASIERQQTAGFVTKEQSRPAHLLIVLSERVSATTDALAWQRMQ